MIEHSLRPSVSFCLVSDKLVFLDVASDRYFCLPPDEDVLFQKFVNRSTTDAEYHRLVAASSCGALLTNDRFGEAPRPTRPVEVGQAVDPSPGRGPMRPALEMCLRQSRAKLTLRFTRFERLLEIVADQKRLGKVEGDRRDTVIAEFAATALRDAGRLISGQDKCLSRSLALLNFLAARRCYPDWIFGVRLAPFAAHCWVQLDGRPIGDTVDYVRRFTVIKVV